MGNTSSEVTNNIKAQADNKNGPEVYKLLNVAGGGILVGLMKTAMSTKNFQEIDDYIVQNIGKFLYSNGEGKVMPIKKLVQFRSGKTTITPKEQETAAAKNKKRGSIIEMPKNQNETKFVCFDLDQRGAVGETLIHLCMLNGTDVHNQLAMRLLKHFPNMVNDIYLSDEYYGENALHIAIVNENPVMVKFLLMCGADVNQRCCGKFFCPDDQKNGRQDSMDTECPTLPINTNYMGYSYFGEYALSFAAILNQEECIRLLIAKKADPNKQDSNGNTVMHMLVINDNLKMFKFMLQFDVNLTIKNRQGLTPLCLAAKLARQEMFQFIMRKTRDLNYIYGDIACASYNLNTLDTIASDGRTDTTSALYLISYGETEDHLELYDEIILDLLNKKWKTYIKNIFLLDFFIYVIYLALNGTTLIMKRIYFSNLNSSSCLEYESEYTKLVDSCSCAYLYPVDNNRNVRTTFEVIVMLITIYYFIKTAIDFHNQGFKLFMQTLIFNPTKNVFLLSLVCTILIIPMRFSCSYYGEDVLTVLSIIMQSTYILYLGRGFRLITTFVYVIHQVIKTNMSRFFAIFFIFMMGFSQAFYIVYSYGNPPTEEVFTSPLQSMLDLLVMAVHDLLTVYNYLILQPYAVVGRFLFIVYVVLVTILLINLLIAMMAHTYDHTSELKKEWIRQWARQVLSIENNVNPKQKLKQQLKYTSLNDLGEKVLVIIWRMNMVERLKMIGKVEKFREVIRPIPDDYLKLNELDISESDNLMIECANNNNKSI